MIENQFSCGLIPAAIAEEALRNFQKHDHQTELIEKCFAPRYSIDSDVQKSIEKVVDDIIWKQMLKEFPHAVVKITPNND